MENGFLESRLYLNKYIAQQDAWNEDTIKKRADLLTHRAINVWSNITTKYELDKKPAEYIYLSEDFDFTGHKPEKVCIFG